MRWYHTIAAMILIFVLLWAVVAIQGLTPNTEEISLDQNQGRDVLMDLEQQHREANPNMTGVLLVVSDFQCPFCAASAEAVERFRMAYGSRFPVEFIHFPVHGEHAAAAAVCAERQGRFWEYHDLLFGGQRFDQSIYMEYARTLELDMAAFTACLQQKGPQQVLADMRLAQMLGVRGTPTFVFIVDGNIGKLEGKVTLEQLAYAAERAGHKT